jgi:transcriptional regulator with XRE-family HTH domain
LDLSIRNRGEEGDRNVGVFAANLDRLMTRMGFSNATLAKALGVSREIVSVWRQGKSLPAAYRGELLAQLLNCTEMQLFQDVGDEFPPMLPIAQWAKREGISIGHAKKLFGFGLLTGSISSDRGELHLVPADTRAPADSKHLVRIAQRPAWVAAFAINLDCRMRELTMTNAAVARATNVTHHAVVNWRSGRSYPLIHRLPSIAEKLRCEVDDLIAEPQAWRVQTWKFRFGHA